MNKCYFIVVCLKNYIVHKYVVNISMSILVKIICILERLNTKNVFFLIISILVYYQGCG